MMSQDINIVKKKINQKLAFQGELVLLYYKYTINRIEKNIVSRWYWSVSHLARFYGESRNLHEREREREPVRLWKTSICPGDRKLWQAHNGDATARSTTMSCDRQKGKAKEQVDERDIGERLVSIGKRRERGAHKKF